MTGQNFLDKVMSTIENKHKILNTKIFLSFFEVYCTVSLQKKQVEWLFSRIRIEYRYSFLKWWFIFYGKFFPIGLRVEKTFFNMKSFFLQGSEQQWQNTPRDDNQRESVSLPSSHECPLQKRHQGVPHSECVGETRL